MNFSPDSLLTADERAAIPFGESAVNLASLNQLAKLFATEDLNVVHDPSATTAMFNTKTRMLVLPAWKDMPKVCYLLFTGHEIGHALWTPVDAFDNPLIPSSRKSLPGYKSVLNVTEDVRIEKRVKRKYPGLRSDFVGGYDRLFKAGFFGDSIETIATEGNIVDRLNVRFKLGSDLAGEIPFHNDEERSFLDRGYNLESFDEAVILANDIYEYMLENEDDAANDDAGSDGQGQPGDEGDEGDSEAADGNSMPMGGDGDDSSDSDATDSPDGAGDDADDDSSEGGEGASSTANSDGGENDSDDDSGSGSSADDDDDSDGSESATGDIGDTDAGKGNSVNPNFDPSSKTDAASRANAESLADLNGSATRRCAIPFDRVDYTRYVHDTKRILEEFADRQQYALGHGGIHGVAEFQNELAVECKKYVNSVKPVVSLMAKEFDMKKAADQHRRSSSARTGVINVGKLHAYKYEEDLFLRKSIVPDAENHGMVMLLDLSGSMTPNMEGTLEQLINLILFCKRVQIPFEVYGFNDRLRRKVVETGYIQDDAMVDEDVYLRKFISSDLKAGMFKKALEYIFFMKEYWGGSKYDTDSWLHKYRMYILEADMLSSTPMNDALILSSGLLKDFRDKTGVQICNFVILSDGDSNSLAHYANHMHGSIVKSNFCGYDVNKVDSYLYDEMTRRSSNAVGRRCDRAEQTAFLLDSLRARTDVRIVGFFVLPGGRRSKNELAYLMGWNHADLNYAELKKNGAVVTGCAGYDIRFAIRGGSSLTVDDSNPLDGVAEGAKVSQIRAAFKKGSKGKIKSRVLLKKFVETIA